MLLTISTGIGNPVRHWVTHNSGMQQITACGGNYGMSIYPPVEMPAACVDCPRCANQAERFEMAMLNSAIRVASTRVNEIEG